MMCRIIGAATGKKIDMHGSHGNKCHACGASFKTKSELMEHTKAHKM